MNAKPTLLILAAGMGSRYGGLKQLDPMGPKGETIIDFSVFDAIRAGFGKIVFIIRRDIEVDFKKLIGSRYQDKIPVEYAYQALDDLPEGFSVPPDRKNPWGTGHAVLIAKNNINEPFAVINADDFYGAHAFKVLSDFLKKCDPAGSEFSIVGYTLNKTLSDHGSVSRGVCEVDDSGFLINIDERTKIEKVGSGAQFTDAQGEEHTLNGDEVVSMNMMGFTPKLFDHLEEHFTSFLEKNRENPKSEFFIPLVLDHLIKSNQATIKILPTPSSWFGVTYPEDKPLVSESIQKLMKDGDYPEQLW